MSIETTYRKLIIEDYIKEQLSRGVAVSAEDVEDYLEELLASTDLTIPQFMSEDHHVVDLENASVAKRLETFQKIRQDLRVLYKDMIALTKVSTNAYERWKLEATSLEKKLIDLEDRIENLLILTQDTEGYHSTLIDNFTDTSQIDLDNSTVDVDLQSAMVSMGTSDAGETRIFLNNLQLGDDVKFKVRTTINYLTRSDAVNSDMRNPFKQESEAWWTSVIMNKAAPVTCEYTVRLSSGDPIAISKIFMELHDSSESSPVSITPLYSVDNQIYEQLPTNTFTQEARSTAIFSFSEVEAKWVKFLLTKRGPDPSSEESKFSYQFGFKEIAFYQQGFEADVVQKLISRPLWVISDDGSPLEFEKLTLEVCERVEENTDIKYYITTSNDEEVPLSPTPTWVPISPVGRAEPKYPVVLDIGDTLRTILGDDETVTLSYDGLGTLVNPAGEFHLLSKDDLGIIQDDVVPVIGGDTVRYSFVNSNDRILNYQIKDTDYVGSGSGDNAVIINESTMEVFRNIGEQNLAPYDTTAKVRAVQRGWRFEDAYYYCVIEIQNPDGMTIDVGDSPIVIDDVAYTNKIDNTVLSGKTASTTGIHTIRINQQNWRAIDPTLGGHTYSDDASYLQALKDTDPLYPYNHKLLIEGFSYDSDYEGSKIYTGADIFAETLMQQVSIFDLMNNVAKDNYTVYALDRDAPDTHTDGNNPTRVFVLKVNENNPDFHNERFMVRFTLVNQLRKYLRIRADLSTEDEKITPALHSYKIKLG